MKVAVVYNRDSQNVINLFGQPNREKIGHKLIERIVNALKAGGHRAIALEGDKDLIDHLEEFMPRVVKGERPGLVFNLSYGIQGQARYTHVPSILEMVGVPYVGSGPLAHSIALDKVVTKLILVQNQLPTPDFAVLETPEFEAPDLPFPLIVKPKHEAVSFGIRVVNDERELRDAAGQIFEMFGQAVLVERFIEGREVNVGLLGNGPPEALPPVELAFGEGGPRMYRYEDKVGKSGREIGLTCPAEIGEELTARAQGLARKAFSAIGCYDCARVDFRLDEEGNLYILEINSLPSLGPRGSYVMAAERVSLDFVRLVNRLVETASSRYFGTPTPPQITARAREPSTAIFDFLTQRRDQIEKSLREWTRKTSRTSDPVGMGRAVKDLERMVSEVGLKPVPELTDARSVFTWETAAGVRDGTLLVWHLDVPLFDGGVEGYRREPEWLYGEGVGTSRAPLVMAEFVLRALRHARALRSRKIGVLYYLDEGRDCRYSADLIRTAMSRVKRVLVLRPGGIGGNVYDQRRGQRRYRLLVEGEPIRPGSASKKPEVLLWLSRKLQDIAPLSSRKNRISVSVTDLRTEGFPMLLPHRITSNLLVTYADSDIADSTEKAVRDAFGRRGPRWDLELIADRPPMIESRANRRLASRLGSIAEEWQIPLATESSVWPSVAGLAPGTTAVLCGAGPVARDLYTPFEAVQRISLMQRTLLLAQYLLDPEGGKSA
jgi:D-alanine-D-alanine ligase